MFVSGPGGVILMSVWIGERMLQYVWLLDIEYGRTAEEADDCIVVVEQWIENDFV